MHFDKSLLVPVPVEIASEPISGECIVNWFWVEAGGNIYGLKTGLYDRNNPHVVKSPYVLPYASPDKKNADVFAQEISTTMGIKASAVLRPAVYLEHFHEAILKRRWDETDN